MEISSSWWGQTTQVFTLWRRLCSELFIEKAYIFCKIPLFILCQRVWMRISTHNNQDEMACDKCGKQFSTTSALKCHISGVHELWRMYGSCPLIVILKRHDFKGNNDIEAVHKKKKPFQCEICDQTFIHVWNLHINRGNFFRNVSEPKAKAGNFHNFNSTKELKLSVKSAWKTGLNELIKIRFWR